MVADGWAMSWSWTRQPGGETWWDRRVAQWLECLELVEGFYARLAAAWGLSFAPLTAEDRLAAARWAAWTGAQPSVALVHLLQDWS